jgi:TRAP-type C4-dicarboxylate transport system permease small subunit
MKLIDRLTNWLDKPINVMLWVALIAAFTMMIHVSVDVFFRTVLNRPFAGTTEIVAGWYMVACAFLPLPWITRNDNHIVAGVFQQIGTKWFAYWLEVLVKVFLLVYIAVFTWETYLRAQQQTRLGEVWQVASSFIPIWPSRWLLPLAGAAMAIYLVLRILRDTLTGLRDGVRSQP